jgi:hypothetical protein
MPKAHQLAIYYTIRHGISMKNLSLYDNAKMGGKVTF